MKNFTSSLTIFTKSDHKQLLEMTKSLLSNKTINKLTTLVIVKDNNLVDSKWIPLASRETFSF